MRCSIDWAGVPAKERLSASTINKLEGLFSKRLPRSRDRSVTVFFVSPRLMKSLNQMYAGHDKVTDVLSFTATEGMPFPNAPDDFLGDVALCLPYIRKICLWRGSDQKEELIRLIVHGVLHCLGFDHGRPKDAFKMIPLQEELVYAVLS